MGYQYIDNLRLKAIKNGDMQEAARLKRILDKLDDYKESYARQHRDNGLDDYKYRSNRA